MKFEARINDEQVEFELQEESGEVHFSHQTHSYQFRRQDNGRFLLRMGTKLYKIDHVEYDHHTLSVTLDGCWWAVDVRNEQDLLLDRMGFKAAGEVGEGGVNAPMPGKILEIMVTEGDEVELGEPVAILEARKMENELKAPMSGRIVTITAAEGDSLEKNALILEIEASG